jgi:tRNA G18 (ribose-2'-O)-methylase SpoU
MSEGGQITFPNPMTRLNAQQLRTASESEAAKATLKERNPLYLILENVYDTYNIGGLFRLADGLNIQKMYLCGEMEKPPNNRIEKASIGTHKIVPWAYFPSAAEAIEDIKIQCHSREGGNPVKIVAVEQDERSVPYTNIQFTAPTALILGNETYGVLPDTLKLADHIAEIPMWGINKSLNVIVSAAIVSFEAMRQLNG